MTSALILITRIMMTIQLIFSFSVSKSIPNERLVTYLLGTIIHALWLFLFWRFPYTLYRYNALVIMLSYQFFLFAPGKNLPMVGTSVEAARNLLGVFNIVSLCTVMQNACWYMTSIGIVFNIISTYVFYVATLHWDAYPLVI